MRDPRYPISHVNSQPTAGRVRLGHPARTSMLAILLMAGALALAVPAFAAPARSADAHTGANVSLALRDVALSEVMAMLSRKQRVNILLGEAVTGTVSVNLYDVSLDEAVRSIAHAAGYAVESRNGTYFVVAHNEAGKYAPDGLTRVETFDISYIDVTGLEERLQPYVSSYGKLTLLEDRRLLLVEDTPEFIGRIARIVEDLDRQPRQVLIEARILEVTLDDSQSYGLDWRKLFTSNDGEGSFGVSGLATPADADRAGFVFDLNTPDIEAMLDTLKEQGRVRTLSTPKLLALENQEASVIVGDRRGFQVTTTINQVTTESIEFLESGVILRVTPAVDEEGSIMLSVHPEVSTGTVDSSGIPSQITTEVTTRLLVPDGQTVFIGGLIKNSVSEKRRGVPVLGDLPGLRRLFSSERRSDVNTETVVLITPRLVQGFEARWNTAPIEEVSYFERLTDARGSSLDHELDGYFPPRVEGAPAEDLELRLSPSLSGPQTTR